MKKKNPSAKKDTAPKKNSAVKTTKKKNDKKGQFSKATEFIDLAGKKGVSSVQESIPYVRVYKVL